MPYIHEALTEVAARHGWAAWRPTGLVLVLANGGAIRKHRGDHTTPWAPNYRDACAADWGIGELGNVFKQLAEMYGVAPDEPM